MNKSVLNLLIGIGAGALAGATAMLFLAPKSGAETREDLRIKYENLNYKTSEELNKMKDKLKELQEKVSRKK